MCICIPSNGMWVCIHALDTLHLLMHMYTFTCRDGKICNMNVNGLTEENDFKSKSDHVLS